MEKYDAVVVGAGNAGMAAALQLLTRGKKVILIEQHNLPGGCATSFRRGRFEIDPSLHGLCSIGSANSGVRKIIDSFGLKLDWCELPDCFRLVTTDSFGHPLDAVMPSGREPFIDKMAYYVPGSRQSVEKLFHLFDQMKSVMDAASSIKPNVKSVTSFAKKIFGDCAGLIRTGGYSAKAVFDALKIPVKAQDILSTYWSYLGVDLSRLNFMHYGMMVDSYVSGGSFIPRHTSHAISCEMAERIRQLGGRIRFNCRAERFLFSGDRLCGVRTTSGDIACDMALANINPDIIYADMMDRRLVPIRNRKISSARKKNYSARMFTSYFCLDCAPEEIGIKDYAVFMPGCADSTEEYRRMLKPETNDYFIFLCYNIANPEFSPKGTCVCSFTTFNRPEEWNGVKPEDYKDKKTATARRMIDTLKEKTGIDISGHVEEAVTASPLTFARYLNTPEGCVYGFEAQEWDGIIPRSVTMAKDYGIKGLYPIGASGVRGDGYGTAYMCGKLMADFAIKKEIEN